VYHGDAEDTEKTKNITSETKNNCLSLTEGSRCKGREKGKMEKGKMEKGKGEFCTFSFPSFPFPLFPSLHKEALH
jgi:hypothetical protein